MKGRKIKNLTREDITIVDYKNLLVKNSAYAAHSASSLLLFVFLLVFAFAFASSSLRLLFSSCTCMLTFLPLALRRVSCAGYAALEKAKLFSKTTSKTKGV